MLCNVLCNDGYGFAIEPAEEYQCAISQGQWEPASRWPIPDCSSNVIIIYDSLALS